MLKDKLGYNRREFLRLAGLSAGAVLTGAQLAGPRAAHAAGGPTPGGAAGGPPPAGEAPTVGVVLPQRRSDLGAHFVVGLQLAGGAAGDKGSAALHVLAATGGVPAGADLLVGWVDSAQVRPLAAACQAAGRGFLNVSLGENMPRAGAAHPALFRHTLGLWQAQWALGAWAARTVGRRALVASAWYESGYDALYAFQAGFESAGGTVVQTVITHGPQGAPSLAALAGQVAAAKPDLVYAAYSGAAAGDFLRAWTAGGSRLPLLGAPGLTDERILAGLGAAARGIQTALAWAPGLTTHENAAFRAAYRGATGQVPDSAALLGYETGCLIQAAAAAAGGNLRGVDRMQAAFAAVRVVGPRGPLAGDGVRRDTSGPLYLRVVQATAGVLTNNVVGPLAAPPTGDAGLAALYAAAPTGCLLPYQL